MQKRETKDFSTECMKCLEGMNLKAIYAVIFPKLLHGEVKMPCQLVALRKCHRVYKNM